MNIQYNQYQQDEYVSAPTNRGLHKTEKIAYTLLAIALCILVFEIALFWFTGAFDRAAENREYTTYVAQNEEYFEQRRGEPSGHDIAVERGLDFSYGLAIAEQEENANEENLTPYANQQLSYIPDYIKAKFSEDGWKFVITSDDLTQIYTSNDENAYEVAEGERITGLTTIADKIIRIRATQYDVISASVHEMGHYVNQALGFPSESDEFKAAMESDFDSYSEYFDYLELDVSEEFYAEAFANYWKHPSEMEDVAPDLYGYFSERF